MGVFNPSITEMEFNEIFPDYRFISELGTGGQADVFKARRNDGTDVAIKIYSTGYVKRAGLEVEKLLQANSVSLAKVLAYGEIKIRSLDCYYVITQFFNGEDLKKIIQRRPLTEAEGIKLLVDITDAIDALWNLKVVHCDIKPANILLHDNGAFKLIDLGFAKHLGTETITAVGVFFGSLGYIAPEQRYGRKSLTLRADFFGLGVTVYEALTQAHPFLHNQQLIYSNYQPTPIQDLISINDNIAKLIHSMMEFNPLKRPNSCSKIIELIQGV